MASCLPGNLAARARKRCARIEKAPFGGPWRDAERTCSMTQAYKCLVRGRASRSASPDVRLRVVIAPAPSTPRT